MADDRPDCNVFRVSELQENLPVGDFHGELSGISARIIDSARGTSQRVRRGRRAPQRDSGRNSASRPGFKRFRGRRRPFFPPRRRVADPSPRQREREREARYFARGRGINSRDKVAANSPATALNRLFAHSSRAASLSLSVYLADTSRSRIKSHLSAFRARLANVFRFSDLD